MKCFRDLITNGFSNTHINYKKGGFSTAFFYFCTRKFPHIMKRKIVLIGLLILPLTVYIYFSMVKHNSLFLPVITKNVNELPKGTTLNDSAVQLKDKISIVGFLGKDVIKKKESIFNLNQKINNKYKGFTDFQMVMVVPDGTQEDIKKLTSDIAVMSDISHWKYVFTTPEEIKAFYDSFKVKLPLDENYGSYYVFIVDKDMNLRGRNGKGKHDKGKEYIEGYNTFSAAELHNEMTDDVKILLREYRLALKKNEDKGVKREI